MIDNILDNDNENWKKELANSVTDHIELLRVLKLEKYHKSIAECNTSKFFPIKVPREFIYKIQSGNINDPLLLQVIALQEELISSPDYSLDPLNEQKNVVPGLLQKYSNRVLLILKNNCAIHCRYCFRKYFPYKDNGGNKYNWKVALKYIKLNPSINEIILSGGDPLMADDNELNWLITKIENIPHIKRLRIHSRLLVVIPSRVTQFLCQRLKVSSLKVIIVTHINHAREIDNKLHLRIGSLKHSNITLLNQSVLLKRVNDNAEILAELSIALFNLGILPYYLHLLDKVQGSTHFNVEENKARIIMRELLTLVPGYLVPRLVKEISGRKSKIPVDLKII